MEKTDAGNEKTTEGKVVSVASLQKIRETAENALQVSIQSSNSLSLLVLIYSFITISDNSKISRFGE